MRIVAWGTYDTGKPRVRILLRGLKENDVEVLECHKDVWGNIEDKSQIKGFKTKIFKVFKWITSYPSLVLQYLKQPKHDAVLISYMGQLDVIILWPFAKLRGAPIIWDAFLSLYNTVVEDRKLISRFNPLAWLLYAWEWLACRAADIIILDTQAHGNYFVEKFAIPKSKVKSIFVGVESEKFPPYVQIQKQQNKTPIVLFYGQFIPLHGISTIIKAAKLAENDEINWVIIGQGQDVEIIKDLLQKYPLAKLQWIPWVEYQELINWIYQADVCLGIFGDTDKASRVIPNKVFQIISAGMPLITMDSLAIRELIDSKPEGIQLVEAANEHDLYKAVKYILSNKDILNLPLHKNIINKISPYIIGKEFKGLLSNF